MENYEVVKANLGTGAWGTVQLVKDIKRKRMVVWKIINYGALREKEKTQLTHEVNILASLKNENIVRYYENMVDKENKKLYIVMEYCAGGDLGKLIKDQKAQKKHFSEDFIWRVFMQLVLALFECHKKDKKILHRDIKPENIFLDEKQNVKLGDFGLARTLAQDSYAKTAKVGTPFYMSPEQIDEEEYNEKSDIWSLGVVMYELAALKQPFQATNTLALAYKIKSGSFARIPEQYSNELQRVISWMLKQNQRDRPKDEDLLNVAQISMRLREKRLNDNLIHLNRKESEIKKLETTIKDKEASISQQRSNVSDLDREVQELERQLSEMQRLKKDSGCSTKGETEANETAILMGRSSSDALFFQSPTNRELMESMGMRLPTQCDSTLQYNSTKSQGLFINTEEPDDTPPEVLKSNPNRRFAETGFEFAAMANQKGKKAQMDNRKKSPPICEEDKESSLQCSSSRLPPTAPVRSSIDRSTSFKGLHSFKKSDQFEERPKLRLTSRSRKNSRDS